MLDIQHRIILANVRTLDITSPLYDMKILILNSTIQKVVINDSLAT